MKKNLLITSVHLGIGGIETVLINILNLIDTKKYNVDLVLYKDFGVNKNLIPDSINIYNPFSYKNCKLLSKLVKNDKITSKIIRKLFYNKITIKKFIKNKKYDVGIAFSGYHYLSDMLVNYSSCQKKYIWAHTDFKYLIDNDDKLKKQFYKTCDKYIEFDKIVCVSESSKKQLEKILPSYRAKITYIDNISNFKKTNEYIKLKGDYNIVCIGRMEPQKGYDRMIDVIEKIINNTAKNICVTVVGDGSEKTNIENIIKSKNMEKYFDFVGASPNVSKYLNSADLFLSTSYSEGAGMVLLEALISRVPIVAPNVNGIKDIFKMAPKNSFLLTDNNVDAIANGIKEAIDGKVNKNFNFNQESYNKKIIEKLKDVYEGKL